MKKIYAIFALALVLVSCDPLNKMLDRRPLDKLEEGGFFGDESGLLSFSNAFYGIFPGYGDLITDDADNYIQKVQLLEVRGVRTVPASGSGWTWTYLRNFNTLLDNAYQCEDQSVREKYTALARFFRAYFYFEKVKRFGDVPWIDHQLGSADPEVYAPRDSRELVMQKMVEDIDYAISHLPSQKSAYTVTKWTALALKSRFCLYEGTFRKYHGITGYEHDAAWYLTQAADAASTFISQSGYSVYDGGNPDTNYLTVFTMDNIAGSVIANDVILARNFNAAYSVTHNSNYSFLVASMGKYGMTRKAVASYLMKDGSRFTDKTGWETMSFAEETAGRDPRLAQSIRIPGYCRIGETTPLAPDLSACLTGYQPIKYVTTVAKDEYNMSDNDLILFRTGEVLLNYAEAKAELENLGGEAMTQNDLDISVNRLRARVGMPSMALDVTEDPFLTDENWGGYRNVSGSNKALILEIRRERMVELNQEGFRYYDLMRWKEGKIFEAPMYGMYFPALGEYDLDGNGTPDILLYTGDKPSSTATVILEVGNEIELSGDGKGMLFPFKGSAGKWNEDKDYLYPIPTDDLQLNTNLVQNPGWEE